MSASPVNHLATEVLGKAFSSPSMRALVDQARDFGVIPSGLVYLVGWLVTAFLLFYFLTNVVGPALFGTRPMYYRALTGNPQPILGMAPVPSMEAMRMNPAAGQGLTQRVVQAVEQRR